MSKDLDELRERKQELILESDINRQIVALELGQLKLKSIEWQRNLTKAGSIYKWVSPIAGAGLGFLAARKQIHKVEQRAHHHNGHSRKAGYMNLVAPLGMAAVRQALKLWRHARQRREAEA